MGQSFVMPVRVHNELVAGAYRHRGYTAAEAEQGARFCEMASWHGIKTHNALKALHLDDLFGSKVGGCRPGAEIERLPSKYAAVQRWNAHRKLGQATALEAMEEAMRLADKYGVGVVAVDNAFHYLWGGGYVIDAARKGYIAYTNCTAALAEVVPFGGRHPTLGTNPHSWGFPTQEVCGFPICIDWATSTIAMGRVQVLKREGKELPAGAAVDKEGHETRDPDKVAALMCFGAHKGYGLSLLNEVYAAYTGGSLPTLRNRWAKVPAGEKGTCCFYFQCMKPDALAVEFAGGRTQAENVKAVLVDILGHGNSPPGGRTILPGELEAGAAALSARHGGLLLTAAEVEGFRQMAAEAGLGFDDKGFKAVEI